MGLRDDNSRTQLQNECRSALERWLRDRNEASLAQAYEIGKQALHQGQSFLDLVALAEDGRGSFLCELLSPFEMALRGYRDANQELQRLNAALALQKEALESVNRQLQAFSYSVSHDLRGPLRRLDSFSHILLSGYGENLDEQGKKYLGALRKSALQMGHLIDALLNYSRVSNEPMHLEEVDLSELARGVVEELKSSEPGREVEVHLEGSLVTRADRPLARVALRNLLSNSWKYSAGCPVQSIQLTQRPARGEEPAVFCIKDTGVGFDMAYADKLFGVFQRLHTTPEFSGIGIGLAVVEQIVARHGGKIWGEGRVGEGASFYFTLATNRPRSWPVWPSEDSKISPPS